MIGKYSNKNITALLRSSSYFLDFDGQNAFFPNSTGPWPQLQTCKKIPEGNEISSYLKVNFCSRI